MPGRVEPTAIRRPSSLRRRFTRNQNVPITAKKTFTKKKTPKAENNFRPLSSIELAKKSARTFRYSLTSDTQKFPTISCLFISFRNFPA